MRNFTYTRGPIETNTPWIRPSYSRLNSWKRRYLKIPGVEKYKSWVVGGVLESWDTWDTDIILQQDEGDIDIQEVERIMTSAIKIGLDNRQLIDIHFQISPYRHLHPTLRDPTRYQATLTLEEFSNLNIEQEVLQIALETCKNGIVTKDKSPDPKRIGNHLWRVKKKFPSEKHIERMERGITYKKFPVLITERLDFKKVLGVR